MEHPKIDNLLSIAEAAEFVGVSRVTIYSWLQSGKIKPIQVGAHLCMFKEELEQIKKGVVERVETVITTGGASDIRKNPAASGTEEIH
jgi:excisionase family DNA binding protein